MKHAVVVNGEPEILTGRVFTKGDGSWLPINALDNMPRAEKLEFGVYEVERVDVGTGPALESVVYTVEEDRVAETYTFREQTAQEIDADEEAVANSLIASPEGRMFLAITRVLFAMRKETNPNMGSAQFRNFVVAAANATDLNDAAFKTLVRDQL